MSKNLEASMKLEKVIKYLRGQGWTRFTLEFAQKPHVRAFWRAPTDCYSPAEMDLQNKGTLEAIAVTEKRSLAALLEEIDR